MSSFINIQVKAPAVPYVTVHGYTIASERLARVNASVSRMNASADAIYDGFMASLPAGVVPVRGSFRWINEDRTAVTGFVHTPPQVLEQANIDPRAFNRVNANVYVSKNDEALWDVTEGASGKYIARRGHIDLRATLASVQSQNAAAVGLSHVTAQTAACNGEAVAYVRANSRYAEVAYGVCTESGQDGSMLVLPFDDVSHPEVVNASRIVAAHGINKDTAPRVPTQMAQRIVASRASARPGKPQRSAATEEQVYKVLTQSEYWAAVYSHAPEYVAAIEANIRETAAL